MVKFGFLSLDDAIHKYANKPMAPNPAGRLLKEGIITTIALTSSKESENICSFSSSHQRVKEFNGFMVILRCTHGIKGQGHRFRRVDVHIYFSNRMHSSQRILTSV